MGAALQEPEHAQRIFGVRRLLQQRVVEDHRGVRTQHEIPRNTLRLLPRQALDVGGGRFSRPRHFYDVCWLDLDRYPEHLEQQFPAWRGRSQREDAIHGFRSSTRVTGPSLWISTSIIRPK